jgi:predicted small metal-binding protein
MIVLNCKDVGSDCDFHVRGRTVDEVLKKATAHARTGHGIKRVTKSYLDTWRMKIHDE